MTSKHLILDTLQRKKTDQIPVTPHWWGLYKFQLAGLIDGYEDEGLAWSQRPEALFQIDRNFYETFKPDMFHLTTAPNQCPFEEKKLEEINRLRRDIASLDSKTMIDEYVALISRTEEDVVRGEDFRHVEFCSKMYGDEVFIALNEGSDTASFFDCHLGFENGLVSLMSSPENAAYMIELLYNNTLERMKALKKSGAHAFINSETYCGSDIMSPALYRDIFHPAQKRFYKKVRELGLYTIAYFTGDIWKILDYIKELDISALMVEESKKTFKINVGELANRLEGQTALFGNLDSHGILEKGTPSDIETETLRQLRSVGGKPFIMANGCPISFNTPADNIIRMIETVRNYTGV